MRYFVTGASGWIGTKVVEELLGAGHEVVGLARSDDAATKVASQGAEVLRGDVTDLDALRRGAEGSDGVVHLAFRHDIAFSGDFATAVASDRAAAEAFGEVLADSDRPFVLASGILGLAPGRVATEADWPPPATGGEGGPSGRADTARYVIDLAGRGVRSSVVRLAPTNHGEGDNGFMRTIVDTAASSGTSAYIGDGANRWTAVHRYDSAALFRLAVESAPPGTVLHGVAEDVAIKDVAEAIGGALGVPVASIDPSEAPAHFTWLAGFLGMDAPASNAATRELLGWAPSRPTLLEDLRAGRYTA